MRDIYLWELANGYRGKVGVSLLELRIRMAVLYDVFWMRSQMI